SPTMQASSLAQGVPYEQDDGSGDRHPQVEDHAVPDQRQTQGGHEREEGLAGQMDRVPSITVALAVRWVGPGAAGRDRDDEAALPLRVLPMPQLIQRMHHRDLLEVVRGRWGRYRPLER